MKKQIIEQKLLQIEHLIKEIRDLMQSIPEEEPKTTVSELKDTYFATSPDITVSYETFYEMFKNSSQAKETIFRNIKRRKPFYKTEHFEESVKQFFRYLEVTKRSSTMGDYRNHLVNFCNKQSDTFKERNKLQIAG